MPFPISWGRKHLITIAHGQVSNTVTNFPVLLVGGNLLAEVFTIAKSDGSDIRFTSDVQGLNQIPFEIVSFIPGSSSCEIWVQVPTLNSSSNTVIYIWYGNANASAYAPTDPFGSQAVWDANFLAVFHGHVSGGNLIDSTRYGNNLSGGTEVASGKVGVGVTGNATKGSAISSATDNITLECWAQPTNSSGVTNAVMDGNGPSDGYAISQSNGNGGSGNHVSNLFGGVGWVDSGGRWSAGTWQHVVALYSGGAVTDYCNGSNQGGGSKTMGVPHDFKIGDDGGGRSSIGNVDEIRFSNMLRSADWILTEYLNMNTPLVFSTPSGATTGLLYMLGGSF